MGTGTLSSGCDTDNWGEEIISIGIGDKGTDNPEDKGNAVKAIGAIGAIGAVDIESINLDNWCNVTSLSMVRTGKNCCRKSIILLLS